MRRALLILAIAGGARAAPAPARPTWADWVGDYRGALRWTDCISPGERSATLAVDAIDGVVTLDLTAAGGGLRPMVLVEDDAGFSAREGDVSVHVTRPKADAIAVAVGTDAGCTMRAQLARTPTSGIRACDQLVGWSRIAERCTKLTGDRLEDPAVLAHAKWRKSDAGACSARADKLALALVDAGCAPHPDPLIGTRGKECLALVALAARFDRCGAAPAALKDIVAKKAAALSAASQTADRSTLATVEQECVEARDTVMTLAERVPCAL